jgi:hypothetical protein
MLRPKDSWPACTGNGTTDRKAVRSFHHQASRRTPSSEIALLAVMLAVTGFMSGEGFNPSPALIDRVMVFNIILRGDRLLA